MPQGQAELDLPDPLERQAPVGSASAPSSEDDLLAQLAGDEIDRLLADADVVRLPPTDARSARQDGSSPVHPPAAVVETPAVSVPEEPQNVEAELNAQLDELFKTMDEPGAKADTVAPAKEGATAPSKAQPDVEQAVAQAHDLSAASPKRVTEPESPVPIRVHPERVEIALGDLPSARRSTFASFLLKPLEVLNFPLADAKPSTRATVGKLAILTLFNALAVLLYVLLFRNRL